MKANNTSITVTAAVSAALFGITGAAWSQQDDSTVYLASASDIIGMDIETNDGHEAGEIEYLLIDPVNGGVRYALVSEDDDLDLMDDELIALPFSYLNLRDADADEIEADVSFDQLTGALKLNEDDIDEFTRPSIITQVYDYFHTPEEDQISAAAENDSAENDSSDASVTAQASNDGAADSEDQNDDGSPHLMVTRTAVTTLIPGMARADRMLGSDVTTTADEDLGEIDDLVLDSTHGRVAYVLVGEGGFLGIGEEWSAYPLRSLTWDVEAEAYVADAGAGASQFRNLPKAELPARVPKSKMDEFYQSFGVEPHGTTR